MRMSTAKILFDLQQEVIDRCLRFAEEEDNQKLKNELVEAAGKAVEVERLFLVHLPRD